MMPGDDDDDVDPSLVEELAKVERYRAVQEAARRRALDPPAGVQRPRRAKKQGSPKSWAGKALDDEIAIMKSASKGQRNDQLNTSAFNLGQIVATGELQFDVVANELRSAALSSGLKPGELKSWDLPERAIRDGMENPRDLSNVGQVNYDLAPVITMAKRGNRVPAEITGTPTDLVPDDEKEPDPDERRIVSTRLSTVKTSVPAWVWEWGGYGRIQLQTLTMFAGKPAAGKSTAVRWFASEISKGTLPGAWLGQPMGVALYSPEEGLSDTLVPSLQVAGANLENIISLRAEEFQQEDGIMSQRDYEKLRDKLWEEDIRALFIDPVMQTFDADKTDGHKNVEVRRALMPYVRLAQEINGIVVCVHHLRKGSLATGVMDMMNGSSAFGEVARCVFGFANIGEGLNVMQQAKNSAGKSDLQLAYELPVSQLEADDGQTIALPRFEIVGPTDVSITDVGGREDESSATTSADVEWLRAYLEREQPASITALIQEAAKSADISRSRVYRAHNKLGVLSRPVPRPDAPNARAWVLPDYVGPNYI